MGNKDYLVIYYITCIATRFKSDCDKTLVIVKSDDEWMKIKHNYDLNKTFAFIEGKSSVVGRRFNKVEIYNSDILPKKNYQSVEELTKDLKVYLC